MGLVGIRDELGMFREDTNRRLGRLEQWVEEHEDEHDDEHDERAKEKRDRRRWTWQQIVAAAAAAATVGGFYLESRGGR